MTRHAILAVLAAMAIAAGRAAPADDGPGPGAAAPPRFTPRHVRFRLRDGVRVTGELTGWDDEGIDGSFARRAWTEIDYRDVWRLYPRLIDQTSADDWIGVGRTLLLVAADQPEAERWSERAFHRARQLGEDHPEAIEAEIAAARREAAEDLRLRAEMKAAIEAERLRADSPEARPWDATPWPVLTDEQQREAVATMRADAARILAKAGLALEPIETDEFLFYSDLPRRETARWAGELDLMYARLAGQFHLEPGKNIFWGKAVIFVFRKRDRYRLVEAEAFDQLAAPWADGICHPVGPKVFVSFYRQPVDEAFAAILVHETVHGFMHRYRTPKRLPTWANEGFADYLASILVRNSPVDVVRRRDGLRYVRRHREVNGLLDFSYADGSWPGPDTIGYNIGYLLVELMIRDRPRAFGRWVDAVKDGKPWEQALEEDFGVTRQRLVETFVRYYMVND